MERLSVEGVMLLCFHQKANSMLAVDGSFDESYPNLHQSRRRKDVHSSHVSTDTICYKHL